MVALPIASTHGGMVANPIAPSNGAFVVSPIAHPQVAAYTNGLFGLSGLASGGHYEPFNPDLAFSVHWSAGYDLTPSEEGEPPAVHLSNPRIVGVSLVT
jgi:hypothetical protein